MLFGMNNSTEMGRLRNGAMAVSTPSFQSALVRANRCARQWLAAIRIFRRFAVRYPP